MSALPDDNGSEESVAVRAAFARLNARRWWILGSTGLFMGIFTAAAFVMSPVYRASVVLAPVMYPERGADVLGLAASPPGGLASSLAIGPRDADTEEALAVLRSREFTEHFIVTHNLMPQLFHDKWNRKIGTWNTERPPTTAKAFKYFDNRVRSIEQDNKTGLITVSIDWGDRNEGAAWANGLVQGLNDEMRTRAIDKAEASKEFLEKELQTTSTIEARDAISRLIDAQVKQRMLAHVTRDYSFRVVDKALAADSDDRLAPQRRLMAMLGALFGFVAASAVVLASDSFGGQGR